jgi:acetyl esterase/lipase
VTQKLYTGNPELDILMNAMIESPPKTTPGPNGSSIHEGIRYSHIDKNLKMDLFLPREGTEAVPCVIVISGGGFRSQTGQRVRHYAEHLVENGFASALIAYRGRPDSTYLASIADAKAAVRFVRSVSGKYNMDPDRIGVVGRSAGATLAGLLVATANMDEFEGDGGHPEFSSRVQAAVGLAGTYDFVARFSDEEQVAIQPKFDRFIKGNGEWIGTPFSPTNEHWIRASAINYVDAKDAPMLLIHSKDDPIVPWMQSRSMHAKLAEVGVQTELEIHETGGHIGPATTMELMITFFRKTLARE